MSGTTSQENADAWSDANGGDSVATQEELAQFTAASNFSVTETSQLVDDVHDLMMWSHEEELLIVRPTLPPTASSGMSGSIAQMALFALLSTLVFGMMRTMAPTSNVVGEVPQKFMV